MKKACIILLVVLLTLLGLPLILLNTEGFQQRVLRALSEELKNKSGATLRVEESDFSWFRGLELHVVQVRDSLDRPVLSAERIDAGLQLAPLFRREIRLQNVRLIRTTLYLNRKEAGAPLNVESIFKAFSGGKKSKPWNVTLSSMILRNCRVRYDVFSSPTGRRSLDPDHLDFSGLSAKLYFRQTADRRTQIGISKLQLKEKSGLNIHKMALEARLSPRNLTVRNLHLSSGRSHFSLQTFKLIWKDSKDPWGHLESASIEPAKIKAYIIPSEFSYLDKTLARIDQPLMLSMVLRGNLSDLVFNDVDVSLKDRITLKGSFNIQNILDPKRMDVSGTIGQLNVSSAGIAYSTQLLANTNLDPEFLSKLGGVNYSGKVSTQSGSLLLTGQFQTLAGSMSTDIRLSQSGKTFNFDGDINSPSFRLDMLLPAEAQVGAASFGLKISGSSQTGLGTEGTVKGGITSIQYKGYEFRNLILSGSFDRNGYHGQASLNDLNGRLRFDGLVNLREGVPVYQFDLSADGFNPFALGLAGFSKNATFAFHVQTDLAGKTLDDLNGSITLDSLRLVNDDKHFFLKHLDLAMTKTVETRQLRIESPILNGEVWGNYQLSTLGNGLKGILKSYLPSLVKANYDGLKGFNIYDFHFRLAPSDQLTNILELPAEWTKEVDIQGFHNESTGKFRMRADIPEAKYGTIPIESAGFLFENPQKEAKFIAFAQAGKGDLRMKVNLDARSQNDKASVRFNCSNSAEKTYSGNVQSDVAFGRDEHNKLTVDLSLKNSNLIVNDSLWIIHPTELTWKNEELLVEHFEMTHSDQYVKVRGIASNQPVDTLLVELNSFSLDDIFDLLPQKTTNFFLGGVVTGNAQCVNVFGKTSMEADLNVDGFSLNHVAMGNLSATSIWDNQRKALLLEAVVHSDSAGRDTRTVAVASGKYFPLRDSLDLLVDANRLNTAFLKPYLGEILYEMEGLVSGKIEIRGPMNGLGLRSDAFFENTSFGIKMLNARFSFTDTIHLTPNAIFFRNILLKDPEGGSALANGIIRHNNFKKYQVSIECEGNNILAMDLPSKEDSYFYGKAYGTGSVSINGTENEIGIDVDLRSEPGTSVTLSFQDNTEVEEAGFIHFIEKRRVVNKTEEQFLEPVAEPKEDRPFNMVVNLQLEVTPDADLTLITDPSTGDEIKAKGTGGLRCVMNNDMDIELYGRYNIASGSYKFIYENLLRRDFFIEDGGSITFSGNPFSAQIDVLANYAVNAQLSDLLTSDELIDLNLNRSSIPVNCTLKLDGELRHPSIRLGLAYPSADDELRRRILSVINTEDMVNQQIVYLMLFGRFSTPAYSTAQNTSSDMSAVWNTGISTLSSQLNRIINSAFEQNNINFNFNYRNSTYDATTPGELGVAMSGTFFNNRLTINSNVGSRENLVQQGGGNQFIGEFEGNLKFKNSQKWNWKFFNRANDNRYFKSALNTQGIGILYKVDFDSVGDIFGKPMEGTDSTKKSRKSKPSREKSEPLSESSANDSSTIVQR